MYAPFARFRDEIDGEICVPSLSLRPYGYARVEWRLNRWVWTRCKCFWFRARVLERGYPLKGSFFFGARPETAAPSDFVQWVSFERGA